ncbi:MAG: RNA polymerase sigma factor [Cyclobacteriaceae bacterium]
METSDEQLMSAVKRGDLEKLGILYDRYNKRIYNYFIRCTRDVSDSGDLTQNTFIRVMKYRGSYQKNKRFETWIFQIARNLVKDHFKKLKVVHSRMETSETIPDAMYETDDRMDRENRLYQALDKLPDDKRELIVMSKFQGLKYEQIAEMRATSVSAIKVQVHRIIKNLREIYFEQLEA